jgi:hypothetical protein
MGLDIQIDDNIIVEFGLGKLGIWQTRLEPIADSGNNKNYYGIAIERYAIENIAGKEIVREDTIHKVGEDIVLVFHTVKAVDSFIADLNILKAKLEESYELPL